MPLRIQQVGATVPRLPRRPKHNWQVRAEPYQIQPLCIAPVLPGETLKSATFQARVVSDPVKNPLIGWWTEYYWFYVKLRDLDGRDDFTTMLMDLDKDISAYHTASSTKMYHTSNATPDSINWTELCLKRVVEEYFRDEGETWDTQAIDGVPISQIKQQSWLDSCLNDTTQLATDPTTPDTGASASDIEESLARWEFMKGTGLIQMSFEEFLTTFNVRMPSIEIHKPELLRYVRDWTYPTNHIDPTDGSPTSALSWSVSERIDKDRFFKEHGFILGCSVTRPKVYLSQQKGSATNLMQGAMSWLPAIMRDEPQTSLKKVTAGSGPLPNNTDDYWVDVRDLFVYGDQFVNFALTETDAGLVAVPTVGLEKRYASNADIDALFVDAAGGNNLIRQDGVISFNILGTQVDQTPTMSG